MSFFFAFYVAFVFSLFYASLLLSFFFTSLSFFFLFYFSFVFSFLDPSLSFVRNPRVEKEGEMKERRKEEKIKEK